MRISINGKNIEVSDYLSDLVTKKVSKLDKYFPEDTEAHVTLSVEKNRHIVEITIPYSGGIIRGEEVSGDMYASIDLVLDKLEAQVKKFVSRNKEIHRKGRANDIDVYAFEVTEEAGERTITGRDHFSPKPMSPDEAAMQLDANDFEFLTFLNSENDRINVIYRRKNGNLGLIDPIF